MALPDKNSPENQQLVHSFLEHFNKNDIKADTLSGLEALTEENIKKYTAVLFFNLEVNIDYKRQNVIQRYVQAGGGIGSFSSTFTHPEKWPWFDDLILTDASEKNKSEYKDSYPHKISFAYSLAGKYNYDGGRLFFAKANEVKQEDITGIANYLLKERPGFEKAQTPRLPEDNRFIKIVLDPNLNEPMELDIFDDGRVIFIEREGPVKLYLPKEKRTKLLANFDVRTEGNYEDGMLGVAIDPDYERNGKIYIYYSVPGKPIQRLSRFFMSYDSLFLSTETVILDVPVQIETCCHSGGSIQFGPNNLLYLSTGDNTSSKESDGYTPIDERPGRAPFDAQKSSGNTHDLRGKILRIKVNDDGSYGIPEGNLFPKDGSEGRPEIYVMGARNPFRISIDPKTGFLYWGDVGPDSGKDGTQGPRSYDEWNQARTPGNYGWPYFVANNISYPDWDFTTNTPKGGYFDPENPVNDSPNNYGSKYLPPARPAMIWYPYAESREWPELGTGSRSAMAGPVYYSEQYLGSKNRFPEYFNGKMFIYDWARSWVKLITFDEEHWPEKIEPFLPEIEFTKPIDMEMGPDGSLYILEYGANYFADNDEAMLSKIEYAAGNRNPVAAIAYDKHRGAAPLEVEFSAAGSYDYDQSDSLTFTWLFPETGKQTQGKIVKHIFEKPGKYFPELTVKDASGAHSTSTTEILVGNAEPEIDIKINGNRTFYFQDQVTYEIIVTDKEDGKSGAGITGENVQFQYLTEGFDEALLGGNTLSPYQKGKTLIENSDCQSCHAISKTSIGPSYQLIAERYEPTQKNIEYLGKKIIEGGNGNWGHSLMAAHPQHSMAETTEMVKYILAINEEQAGSMGNKGTLAFNKHGETERGRYYFKVSYTDKGANNMPPIKTQKTLVFRSPKVEAEDYEINKGVQRIRPNGGDLSFTSNTKDGHYFGFNRIDLTGVKNISFNMTPTPVDAKIVIRIGSSEGKIIGEKSFEAGGNSGDFKVENIEIKATTGLHDLYFIFESKEESSLMSVDWIEFRE